MINSNLNNQNNALNNILETNQNQSEEKFAELMNGVDDELRDALIGGYNFSVYKAEKNMYEMIVKYKGKTYSEFFKTEHQENIIFVFADLNDKFRAISEIKKRIQSEEKTSEDLKQPQPKPCLVNKNKLPRKNGGYWQWNNLDFNCWHCGYDIENGTGYYDCQNIEDLEKNKTDWNKAELKETISLNLPNRKRFAYRLYCEVCSQAKGYDSDYRTNQQWRKDWDEEYLRRSKLFHAHHKYEGEKLVTLNRHLFYQGFQKWLKTQTNLSEESKIKEFLLTHSRLLKAGENKPGKIFVYRDKIYCRMIDELRKYYKRVIRGDYWSDGMPQISGGIRDWAEDKIWQLLILIGEPNHLGYEHISNDYWAEK